MISEFAGEWGKLRLFKKAFEVTQLGVTITDITGKIIYTNPADAKIHGYTVDELLGQDVRIFAPSELRRPLTPEKLKEIKTLKRESINLRKDGSVFPVQLLSDVVIDADGNPVGIVTICEDITERVTADENLQQAQEMLEKRVHQRTAALTETIGFLEKEINERKKVVKALKDSEGLFRQLFEIIPKPLLVYDLESRAFLEVNEEALHRYGYSRKEFMSMTVDDFGLAEEIPESLDRVLADADNSDRQRVNRCKRKNGTIILAEITTQLLIYEGKKAMLVLLNDLTERECFLIGIERINQCFLNFVADYTVNVNRLTAVCGELLGADNAYYIRLDNKALYTVGQWPETLHSSSPIYNPERHYCYAVIKKGETEILVTPDLCQTAYAHVGFPGAACISKTNMSKAVKNSRGKAVGALCVAYQKKITPTETQKKIMETIAAAIEVEEERRQAQIKPEEVSS